MANEPDSGDSAFVRQTGLSVEAIEVTLKQHDRSLGDINNKINNLSTQFTAQNNSLRTELQGSISGLSTEIRAQQQSNINNSRTPWIQLIIACVTVGGFVWAVGRGAIAPLEDNQIRSDRASEKFVDKVDEQFKQVYATLQPILSANADIKSIEDRQQRDELELDGKWTKAEQKQFALLMDERKDNFNARLAEFKQDVLRTEDEIRSVIRSISDNLVTRAENTAHWGEIAQRIDALSARLNDLQKYYNDIFPGNEVIKEMQAQLREMRQQLSAIPPVIPVPTTK